MCSAANGAWGGLLRDGSGKLIDCATVLLRAQNASHEYAAKTSPLGEFSFTEIPAGTYTLIVTTGEKTWSATTPLVLTEGPRRSVLELSAQDQTVRVLTAAPGSSSTQA